MNDITRILPITALLVWQSIAYAGPNAEALGKSYQADVRSLLQRYCQRCHSERRAEAEIDLQAFGSIEDVRRQPGVWLKVREMLDSGQMPPPEARQPSEPERMLLRKWVREWLTHEAEADAGDPGPVMLRRLSNAEYTYTIRDLTGVDSLDPAKEFPVDGAAGEGFTNTGSGQGMSPALVRKYLDAAKRVAEHVVLLPDGIRFSPHTSRRDQTNALLADIQAFYRGFTADGGGTLVDLQGIRFDTNQGGVLPLERYLAATLEERDSLAAGRKSIADVARERALSPKYLSTLWDALTGDDDGQTFYLDPLREKWRKAKPGDQKRLADAIVPAQQGLWKFNPVGHLARPGEPGHWMEAVSPISTRQEFRWSFGESPDGDVVLSLAASDLGDGNDSDIVVWERPRLEFKAGDGRPPVLLRDVRALTSRVRGTIASEVPLTRDYLAAVVELRAGSAPIEEVARSHRLNPTLLRGWARLVGFADGSRRRLTGHLLEKVVKGQGYDAVNGWATKGIPNLLTNRSDEPISFLTLTVPARGVTVHPSPDMESVVAWQSPTTGRVRIEGLVADADDKCGNGATWRAELMSTAGIQILAEGTIDNGGRQRFRADRDIAIERGDVISLIVNARDGSHICDTTHVDLSISETQGENRTWNLASEVVDDVLEGNPLGDRHGNEGTWHFLARGKDAERVPAVPPGSALDRWRSAVLASKPPDEIATLAAEVQDVLSSGRDEELSLALLSWHGPLNWIEAADGTQLEPGSGYGLDPANFGDRSDGLRVDSASLRVRAPQVLEVRLPAELLRGAEFVTTGSLHPRAGADASVALHLMIGKPGPSEIPTAIQANSGARPRVEEAMRKFRELFPLALCYARIVPVDEVVTLTLYHREDHHLKRLMLDDEQVAELDLLWEELFYVSQEPLQLAVAFEQLSEFATQDRPDLVKELEPSRSPINARAEAFRRRLIESQPAHLDAVIGLADDAWRRPLTESERQGLRDLYQRLRAEEVRHEEAVRLVIARILTSAEFLYKIERPAVGTESGPVSGTELATRLSYFLWSSAPDAELRAVADSGRLTGDEALLAQTRRMRDDPRVRRLAEQFACQWLHVRDFDRNDDKNEALYPEFADLRDDMYEETVLFFEDMFRHNGPILDLLDADHTFLNETVASHYGINGLTGPEWRRVEGIRAKGRGGVLGMATVLASQSGASRSSPILRGNWVYETLLGERLPRPPADVPQLPDLVPEGFTERQLIERHSLDTSCAKCHARIDPYGFALEQYDAIGRIRTVRVDTRTTLPDGSTIEGIEGLRAYLLRERRDDVVRQFCRKLLGFALGREVLLSDEPLLMLMHVRLAENGYRFSAALETIVTSKQFREIRGERAP